MERKIPKVTVDAFKEIEQKLKQKDHQKVQQLLNDYIKRFKEDQPVLALWVEETIALYLANKFKLEMSNLLFIAIIFNESLRIQAEIDEVTDMLK